METIALAAKPRKEFGKGPSRRVRLQGLIPATLYGHGMKPLSLQVDSKEFNRILHTKAGENAIISMKVEGVQLKESTCRIREIQHHPVNDRVDHVDFTVISMTEKIAVKVPFIVSHFEEAPGAREGGILDVVHHEIEVECLPTQIPDKIELNIKTMKIGDAVHSKELVLPAGVKSLLPEDEVVVTIHPPHKEEVAAVPGEGAAEPAVIEKGKKPAEGEAGKEAPAAAPKAEKAQAKGEK